MTPSVSAPKTADDCQPSLQFDRQSFCTFILQRVSKPSLLSQDGYLSSGTVSNPWQAPCQYRPIALLRSKHHMISARCVITMTMEELLL